MSCTPTATPPPAAAAPAADRRAGWAAAALVLVACAGLYAGVLQLLAQQWWTDADSSYGMLVPLFCLWLVLRQRRRWPALPIEPERAGWLCIAGALGLLLVGQLGAELLFTRVSLLLMLCGLLLALLGRAWLRRLAFPLGFLAFMIPLPALIYNQLTLPLQGLATRLGVGLVAWTGIPVLRQGNLIQLPGAVLDVVAACSGIRSLLALLALATAYGYLTEARWPRRLALALAMIPLAVASNAVRIGLTILLTLQFGDAASHGIWHLLTGLQVFLVAVLGMVLLQRWLGGGRLEGSHA